MERKLLPKNENGSVVVLALIMVVLLSLLGMAVSRTSSVDVQVASNEKAAVKDLYLAESGGDYALESYNTWWMTDAFLTTPFTSANVDDNRDVNGNGTPDNRIQIRCIERTGSNISSLSPDANDLPAMNHIGPPPAESKTSIGQYVVRRYGITSTTLTSGTTVQMGVYKFFNNPNAN